MRRKFASALLLVAAVAGGCSKPTAPEPESLDAFQGTWDSIEPGGKPSRVIIKFDDDKFVIQDNGDGIPAGGAGRTSVGAGGAGGPRPRGETGTFAINSKSDPKQIDLVANIGEDQGKTRAGIYTFEGDNLKICLTDFGEPRRTEFVAKEKSVVWVLKKRK